MEEAENIILVLKEAKQAISSNNTSALKNLSDRTIHTASIYQDADNIIVAVVIYSIAKILERENYRDMKGWKEFYSLLNKNLDSAIKNLQAEDFDKFMSSMGKIRNSLNEIEGSLADYIKDIFYKAGINKAFKLYEHGLSAETTASMLGVSLWDLASYMGQTTVAESHLNEALPIKERIKKARQIGKIKNLVFDSGPLISLTMNGLLFVLEELKDKFPETNFIITPQVKKETIDKAFTVKKYALEAVKLQTLIDKNILTLATEEVSKQKLEKETQNFLNLANSCFKAEGRNLSLIQLGEASCLAFANLIEEESLIVTDERTARLYTESPENLKIILERKLHSTIGSNQKNLREFRGFSFIRSSELLVVAYENDLFEYKKDKTLLDALLYSVKYSGTSISTKEIEEIKSLI